MRRNVGFLEPRSNDLHMGILAILDRINRIDMICRIFRNRFTGRYGFRRATVVILIILKILLILSKNVVTPVLANCGSK